MRIDKDFAWGIIDKIAHSATSFVPSLIVAYFYSVNTYGDYYYSFSVSILISSVSVIIDDKVLKKYYLSNSSRNMLRKASTFRTCAIVLAVALFFLIQYFIEITQVSTFIALFCINFIVLSLSYSDVIELQSSMRLAQLAKINTIYSVAVISLFIVLSSLQFDIETIMIGWILTSAIKTLIIRFEVSRGITNNVEEVELSKIFKLAQESLPFGFAAIAFMVYSRMDALMIKFYLSSEEVAIYSLASQIIAISTLVIVPLQVVAFPVLKETYHEELQYQETLVRYTRKGVLMYLTLFVILTILFGFYSSKINPEYCKSLWYLNILFFSGMIGSLSCLRSTHITLKGLGSYLLKVQLIALAVNLGLNMFLIPWLGGFGAATATLVAQFISLVLSNLLHSDLKDFGKVQYNSMNIFRKS